MFNVTIKIPDAVLNGLGPRNDKAHTAGLKRVAGYAQQIAVRKAAAIRRRRIPTRREVALYAQKRYARKSRRKPFRTASETPAWKATGELLKAIEAEPVFEKDTVILTADVPYGRSRMDLGTPAWMPKKPALGIIRRDPIFAETKEVTDRVAGDLYSDGYRNEWERGS